MNSVILWFFVLVIVTESYERKDNGRGQLAIAAERKNTLNLRATEMIKDQENIVEKVETLLSDKEMTNQLVTELNKITNLHQPDITSNDRSIIVMISVQVNWMKRLKELIQVFLELTDKKCTSNHFGNREIIELQRNEKNAWDVYNEDWNIYQQLREEINHRLECIEKNTTVKITIAKNTTGTDTKDAVMEEMTFPNMVNPLTASHQDLKDGRPKKLKIVIGISVSALVAAAIIVLLIVKIKAQKRCTVKETLPCTEDPKNSKENPATIDESMKKSENRNDYITRMSISVADKDIGVHCPSKEKAAESYSDEETDDMYDYDDIASIQNPLKHQNNQSNNYKPANHDTVLKNTSSWKGSEPSAPPKTDCDADNTCEYQGTLFKTLADKDQALEEEEIKNSDLDKPCSTNAVDTDKPGEEEKPLDIVILQAKQESTKISGGNKDDSTSEERCSTSEERCNTSEERCNTSEERCSTSEERCSTSEERCSTSGQDKLNFSEEVVTEESDKNRIVPKDRRGEMSLIKSDTPPEEGSSIYSCNLDLNQTLMNQPVRNMMTTVLLETETGLDCDTTDGNSAAIGEEEDAGDKLKEN